MRTYLLALAIVLPGAANATSQHHIVATSDIRGLSQVTRQLLKDTGVMPSPSDWADWLVSPQSELQGWNGPYLGRVPADPWGRPYIFAPGKTADSVFGVYSMGRNGVDEHGDGDDISSWLGYDQRHYRYVGSTDTLLTAMSLVVLTFAVIGLLTVAVLMYRAGKSVLGRQRAA